MGYGLLDIANQSRREALQGISEADRRREEIEASNKMMAAQQKAQKNRISPRALVRGLLWVHLWQAPALQWGPRSEHGLVPSG